MHHPTPGTGLPAERHGRRKFIVDEAVRLSLKQQLNAQGKARADVLRTATDMGYIHHPISYYRYTLGKGKPAHHYPVFSHWWAVRQARAFARSIREGDTLLIQDFYLDYMQLVATEGLRRGARVIFLVHDVQCLRLNKPSREVDKLNNASLLLVHTEAMREKLGELGVTTPMRVVQLFDYYASSPMATLEQTLQRKHEVVFAGNLEKSSFLPGLAADGADGRLSFSLYGMTAGQWAGQSPSISYKGSFFPDETGSVQGGWGLVWDGDDTHSCTGPLGNYLRYNASHKASLYLACGMPLIVWQHSGLAPWVTAHKAGIAVESLDHLGDIIDRLSPADYRQLVLNARQTGHRLRQGYFLKQSLATP